jgi:hypothetical protein
LAGDPKQRWASLWIEWFTCWQSGHPEFHGYQNKLHNLSKVRTPSGTNCSACPLSLCNNNLQFQAHKRDIQWLPRALWPMVRDNPISWDIVPTFPWTFSNRPWLATHADHFILFRPETNAIFMEVIVHLCQFTWRGQTGRLLAPCLW